MFWANVLLSELFQHSIEIIEIILTIVLFKLREKMTILRNNCIHGD